MTAEEETKKSETAGTETPATKDIDGNQKKGGKKGPPPNLVIPPKKPKLTKAERRALQEAQRAAKAAGGGGGQKKKQQQQQKQQQQKQQQQKQQQQQSKKQDGNQQSETSSADAKTKPSTKDDKTVDLFSHLPQYKVHTSSLSDIHSKKLHPDVLELGRQFATGSIRGGNARCRAMLQTFSKILDDYVPPPNQDMRKHFDLNVLKPSFTYWTIDCRPHSVSMGNAFTFLKTAVASLDRDEAKENYSAVKEMLQETIQQYIQVRLEYADQAIAQHALQKIVPGDVLLTFGYAEVVSVVLQTVFEKKTKDFFVWIVDAPPFWEGKQLLKLLQSLNVSCGYIHLNALTYVMKRVTKVVLGASALMSNGSIFGRVGTACIALLAKDLHIPVLVCCETYKISNRVQLESITNNELGNPDDLIFTNTNMATAPGTDSNGTNSENNANSGANSPDGKSNTTSGIERWRETPNLKVLHLMYDLTPSEFVSAIVTELGIIPPTSVAVLLREMNPQDSAYS